MLFDGYTNPTFWLKFSQHCCGNIFREAFDGLPLRFCDCLHEICYVCVINPVGRIITSGNDIDRIEELKRNQEFLCSFSFFRRNTDAS